MKENDMFTEGSVASFLLDIYGYLVEWQSCDNIDDIMDDMSTVAEMTYHAMSSIEQNGISSFAREDMGDF